MDVRFDALCAHAESVKERDGAGVCKRHARISRVWLDAQRNADVQSLCEWMFCDKDQSSQREQEWQGRTRRGGSSTSAAAVTGDRAHLWHDTLGQTGWITERWKTTLDEQTGDRRHSRAGKEDGGVPARFGWCGRGRQGWCRCRHEWNVDHRTSRSKREPEGGERAARGSEGTRGRRGEGKAILAQWSRGARSDSRADGRRRREARSRHARQSRERLAERCDRKGAERDAGD